MAVPISNSQRTQGNDGPWYSFAVRVGSPPQTVFVLPSTSLRQILIILPEGCEEDSSLYGIYDPSCVDKRGGDWNESASTTYVSDSGSTGFFDFQYTTEEALNASLPAKSQYGANIIAGVDTVTFGFEGIDTPPLQQQLISGSAATNPYLGLLPLSPYNATAASYTDTHYSVMGALNATGSIPSRSWAYNAGAPYRNAFGSLTFGGYDSNRGNVNNVLTTYMSPTSDRELTLAITSIQLHTNSQPNPPHVGGLSITTLIDSTVPEIWLPTESCRAFEDAFGITWDEAAELYLVNDTLHQSLTAQNASVTFTLAPNTSYTSTTVNITLPYASFNLTAAYPLAGINDSSTSLRYFPLKRATESSQYFLGRTFFQEAYISANFDTGTFNVSQATFDQPRANLTVMYPYQITGQTKHKPSGLSGGAIGGIVVGALAILALIAGLAWWWYWRRKQDRSIRRWARKVPGTSIGATSTTIDVGQEHRASHEEFYKPTGLVSAGATEPPMSEQEPAYKRTELDAMTTVRPRHHSYDRTELPAGSVRRASDQSRASRPSISPLDQRRSSGHIGHFSMGSGYSSAPSGYGSPPLGAESPPLLDARSPSPGFFELHGHSRGPSDSSVRTYNPPSELDAYGNQQHRQEKPPIEAGEQVVRDSRAVLQGRWGESALLEQHIEHDEEAATVEENPRAGQRQDSAKPPLSDIEKQ